MDNEKITPKTEDPVKIQRAMEESNKTYDAINECMAYQRSLKQPVEKWETEVYQATQKAQQEARETREGV